MNEALMVNRMKNGDEEAFDYCYLHYQNLVYYEIYKIVKSRETAEEVMQDTFLKMYQNINTFDGKCFTAWLVKIAKNTAINEFNKNKKEQSITFEEELYVDKKVITEFSYDALWIDLADLLDPVEFQILVYVIIYRLTYRTIAKMLDLSLTKVNNLYASGLQKAKKYFKK